ncbi:transmembrane protein 221 [Electrophorus electricus]|uniref:Uncharacterized protein n=1 Tax=Electrophorus electricus TaxID=8005 RepID=A0AAY5EJG2_ELEEL|nr:transmembrane protein 221 [Electrophorus electricus]
MTYSHRSLIVLALLGILSAIMSVMSVILIFQLQALQASLKEPSSLVPIEISAVLRPVSTVLSALSLTLNLSSVVLCLLHSYFPIEICRGEDDSQRAAWFLLDNRAVRHVAVGLFCFGVSVYLGAMSIYMLLVFEIDTGIASMCVLSSGVVVLLVIVAHSLVQAAHTVKHFRKQHINTLFKNDPEHRPGICTPEFSYRSSSALKQYSQSIDTCNQSSESEAQSGSVSVQMHKTLSAESGLLQAHTKPGNGVNNEMRSVLARKVTEKDSTLV